MTDTAQAFAQLRHFVTAIHPLAEAEWEDFTEIWSPFEAKRKTVLTVAGEMEKHLYFVLEGIQRAYYITNDGREATIVFTYPPSFSGVADSLLTRQPSRYFFETLTQSSFLRTSWQQVSALMDRYHNFERMIRIAAGHALAGALERHAELQCFTAEEKFRTLLKRSPHVLRLIPHKYLASYLGLDPTTFSKLLGSVKL